MNVQQLQIYFTSDVHAYIYPTDYHTPGEMNIGLFKCANRFHKDGNTLVIDGGDILQGSSFGAYVHDSAGNAQTLAEVMNACGYDYVTLGNHDFNYGMEYQHSYLEHLHARCLCQNIVSAESGEVCYPYVIHTLENGLRVGLVGIVTDYVNIWEKAEHLAGICITDPVAASAAAAAQLRDQVDLLIGIYHGGFERDLETGRLLSETKENLAYQICEEQDYDILLTGHQHMRIEGQWIHGTYAVQTPDAGRAFISLTVMRGEDGAITCKSELVDAGGVADPAMLERFQDIEHGAQTWLDEPVGHLNRPLMPSSPLEMAARGSDIADFFNLVQLSISGADLSACGLANEVVGLPLLVHRRDVLSAYPYPNTLVVMRITGAQLRQCMERSAEYFDLDENGHLCISDSFLRPKVEHYNYDYYAGVDYEIDATRPIGDRITRLDYHGKPVQPEDSFTICTNNYRSSGTGGYPAYPQCEIVREINMEMAELILDYFRQTPEVSMEEGHNIRVLPQ